MVGAGISPAPTPLVRVGMAIPDTAGRNLLRIGLSDGGGYIGGQLVTRGGFEFEPFAVAGGTTLFQAGLTVRKRFQLGPGH